MAKQNNKEFKLPIELTIDQSTYSKLVSAVGSSNISDPVKELIEEFLIQYSQGGFVISANDINRMSQAAGEAITSSLKVVEAVDKVSHRREGAYEFSVSVDPNMVETFNDVATSKGMSLQDIVQEAWASACAAGWLYAVPTPCQQFLLSEGQHNKVAQILGTNTFNGSDIFNKLVSSVKESK